MYPGIADELFAALRKIARRATVRPRSASTCTWSAKSPRNTWLTRRAQAAGSGSAWSAAARAHIADDGASPTYCSSCWAAHVYQPRTCRRRGSSTCTSASRSSRSHARARCRTSSAQRPRHRARRRRMPGHWSLPSMRCLAEPGAVARTLPPRNRPVPTSAFERAALAGELAAVSTRAVAHAARQAEPWIPALRSSSKSALPAWVRQESQRTAALPAGARGKPVWSPDESGAAPAGKAAGLVRHACETSPYYRSSMEPRASRPMTCDRWPISRVSDGDQGADPGKSRLDGLECVSPDQPHRGHDGRLDRRPMRFIYDRTGVTGARARPCVTTSGRDGISASRAPFSGVPPRTCASRRNFMARMREQWVERRMILDASALDEAAMAHFAEQWCASVPCCCSPMRTRWGCSRAT